MTTTTTTTAMLVGLAGEFTVWPTAEAAASALAATLVEHVRRRLSSVESVHLGLSGGSSATLLGSALQANHGLSPDECSRVHLWMVDERCVSDDDPNLNFSLVRSSVATALAIPSANLHPMPVLRIHGDREYEHAIEVALSKRPADDRRFDAVVLGMGTDGHTASLFPRSPALDEHQRLVVFNDGEQVVPPRPRMTLTYPALSSAHLITLLVTGAAKRATLARAGRDRPDPHDMPVRGLLPHRDSTMIWYLDQAAAPSP